MDFVSRWEQRAACKVSGRGSRKDLSFYAFHTHIHSHTQKKHLFFPIKKKKKNQQHSIFSTIEHARERMYPVVLRVLWLYKSWMIC